ncbi:MAG: 3-hydroxyacyl-CoA dehydrogenase NAD-binding domain-containing protein [Bacteroidota bacterium]
MAIVSEIKNVGVVGSGKLGTDIFYYLLPFGFTLVWKCIDAEETERVTSAFKKKLARQLKCGLVDETAFAKIQSSVVFTSSVLDLADCNLVIECIWENKLQKQKLFRELTTVVSENCVLVSNSSSIPHTELFVDGYIDQQIAGMHFFYPIALNSIVEVMFNKETSMDALNLMEDFCNRINKKVVLLHPKNFFILNRLFLEVQNEACKLVAEGKLTYRQVDDLVNMHLYPSGVFSFFDQVGNDIMLESVKNYAAQERNLEKYSNMVGLLQNMCSRKAFGVKSKIGFYSYTDAGQLKTPQAGTTFAKVPTDKLIARLQKAYIARASQIVEDGICDKELLEFAAKEYTNADMGPFELADEIKRKKLK